VTSGNTFLGKLVTALKVSLKKIWGVGDIWQQIGGAVDSDKK
jgi:hypothetical protein